MKQILTTMLLAVASLLTFGQGTITASGSIVYATTGTPVNNLNYTVSVYDSNGLVTHTGVTDNFGFFYDTISLTSMLGQFPVFFEFTDCNGSTYFDSTFVSPGNWHAPFDSALYCQSNIPCDPNFTTSVVNDTVVTHTIINVDTSSVYTWNLPNGAIANGPTVTYVLNNYNTNYSTCIGVYNTAAGCVDSLCQSFSAGVPISIGPCDPTFTTTVTSDTVITHTIVNPNPSSNYTWTLSNGTTFGGATITYILNTFGQYSMCVNQSDSASGCMIDTCSNFTAGIPVTPTGCDPTFTTTVVNDTVVTHTVTNPGANDYHYWFLPNGMTSSNTTVTYTLNAFDSAYSACLVVGNTAAACSDTLCETFSAGIVPVVPPGDIYGTINAGGSVAYNANVYLISLLNSPSGILLVAVDSTITTNGNYAFNNVLPGNYYVKAALNANDSLYSLYLPSYYAGVPNGTGVIHWTNAGTVNSSPGNSISISFDLVQGANTGGPGFIGGLVSQGANKTAGPGDLLSGVLVILLDENDNPITYVNTDAQGEFKFDNLAYGTYKVYTEVAGIPTTPVVFTIDAENESTDKIRVEVNSTHVDGYIASPSSTKDFSSTTMSVYPNPITDVINIQVIDEIGETASISIVNMNGQIVLQETLLLTGSNTINTSDIAKGYYLMNIQIGEQSSIIKLVK